MNNKLDKLKQIKDLMEDLKDDEFFPKYIYQIFQEELYLAALREEKDNVLNKYRDSKDLLVNLGAANQGKPGFVNVDMGDYPGINCIYDCRKSLPFPDNSVKGIFSEHFFEHMDYEEEIPRFLSECYRVLKVGGVIRLIVPDMEMYLRGYCEDGWEKLSEIRPLDVEHTDFYFNFKYKTKAELINVVFRQQYQHKYAYDYETLETLLYNSGFSHVQKQGFGKSLMNEICIDRDIRESESLYVEGVK